MCSWKPRRHSWRSLIFWTSGLNISFIDKVWWQWVTTDNHNHGPNLVASGKKFFLSHRQGFVATIVALTSPLHETDPPKELWDLLITSLVVEPQNHDGHAQDKAVRDDHVDKKHSWERENIM